MNCALLSPGPSLARLTKAPAADVTIAVKRAALPFGCDWLAILDSPALKEYGGIAPAAQLLTRREYRPKYTVRPGLACEDLACPVLMFDLYTATAALALAGYLKATRVDVYGADWTDAPDFDGHTPAESNRTPQRWALERGVWANVVGWLAGKGCEVVRH